MNLFVGQLSYDTEDGDLSHAFEAFGEVNSARVIRDRDTGRHRGFGFVEMPDSAQAKNAQNSLDGSMLQGRNIVVNEAKPRETSGARRANGRY
ncbi:MAG: RNA-binding protein [Armatimonadetes bacterium]|nr:RNA-binding protein [Armatimonadota bacterium]